MNATNPKLIGQTKLCCRCCQEKDASLFSPREGKRMSHCRLCRNQHNREVKSKNIDKIKARRREIYASDPKRQKEASLKSRHGMKFGTFDAMLYEQNGLCAICHRPEKLKKLLAVDHDHKSKRVRALLCRDCNVAIGLFREDPNILQNAIDYINLHFAQKTV